MHIESTVVNRVQRMIQSNIRNSTPGTLIQSNARCSTGSVCLMALPESILITTKVQELALFEPSLYCHLPDDKITWRWCIYPGNVFITTYDLI